MVDKRFRLARPFIVLWVSRSITSSRVLKEILVYSMSFPTLLMSSNFIFAFSSSALSPLIDFNGSSNFKNLVIN